MIEIKGVTKRFLNDTVINYKDMVFESGKSYLILGASGCGKSTLLNMIAGVLTPTSGEILIDGVNFASKSKKEKDEYRIKNIGYIFQDFKLIDEMTVKDNINILNLENIDTSDADEILCKLEISDQKNKKVRRLSGGQKQRVAIARALVKKPALILADEPTGNLNYSIGEIVTKELIEVSRGNTLIAVSHDERLGKFFDYVIDMNELSSCCDDVFGKGE